MPVRATWSSIRPRRPVSPPSVRLDRTLHQDKALSHRTIDEQGAIQDSGFDSSNGGNDIVDIDMASTDRGEYGSVVEPVNAGPAKIEIRNARFVDANNDNVISRGEACSIVFEIYNVGDGAAENLQPTVYETTGNKHILVSPAITIEHLGKGRGMRYTANILADKSLKAGEVRFSVAVVQGQQTVSKVLNFSVKTAK